MDRSPPNIVIKALLDQDLTPNRLCPVDSLCCWLALSDPWGIDAIFANPKSHKKMNRGAVSQLLVTTINRSHPGVLAKAHDVRKQVPLSPGPGEYPLTRSYKPCSGNPPAYS